MRHRVGPWMVAAVSVILAVSCGADGDTADAAGNVAAASSSSSTTGSLPSSTTSEPDAVVDEPATVDASPTTSTQDEPTPVSSVVSTTHPDFDFTAVSPLVESVVADRRLNGAGLVVVHRDHGVIHHEHWGEFDPDRISLIASASKMITAGVLMRLHDQGLLDIDAPLAEVVPWGSANPTITTAQLLSNSSGLVGLFPNPAFAPYLCQYTHTGSLQDCGEAIFTTALDDAVVAEPDEEFRYGGGQWQVAGAVAEAVSGLSWAELVEETYGPCAVESLGYNNHFLELGGGGFVHPPDFDSNPSVLASTANPNMEGGAYIASGDYGALLLMHLREGRCGDHQVLSVEALARMHTDRVAEMYGGDADGASSGYGLGWWIDRDRGYIRDPGAYGAVPWLDLDDGYGAYLVLEADSSVGRALAEQLYDVIDEIVAG